MRSTQAENRSFRLMRVTQSEIWLEFDGRSGLEDGLRHFLADWCRAEVRPSGASFAVIANCRDFASMAYWGPSAASTPVPVGSLLLLRVDQAHPYFGDTRASWVLVRPYSDSGMEPELTGRVDDAEKWEKPTNRLAGEEADGD